MVPVQLPKSLEEARRVLLALQKRSGFGIRPFELEFGLVVFSNSKGEKKAFVAKGGVDPKAIAAALPTVVGSYTGATGAIVWDERGQRIDPPLDIIEYKGGKFETVGTVE
jgi:hypothetical protein